jgi:hypothetical protein
VERGQQGHEPGAAPLAGERVDRVADGAGDGQPQPPAGRGPHRGPWPVGRQLDRDHAGEPLPPVVELTGQVQPRPTPGVAGVRRGRPGRLTPGVQRCQLVAQHAERPAVGDDVVGVQQEHVGIRLGRQPQQHAPRERAVGQVERFGEPVGRGSHGGVLAGHCQLLERQRRPGLDPLYRPAVRRAREPGAQRLVPAPEPVHAGSQPGDVQRPGQAQREQLGVGRIAGFQLVGHPQLLLLRGQPERPGRPVIGTVTRVQPYCRVADRGRERVQLGVEEDQLRRQLDPQRLPQLPHQPRALDRAAAEFEEVGGGRQLGPAEHVAPRRLDHGVQVVGRAHGVLRL